ncbi:hypothetical protein RHSIM_Rhsim09G0137800 [Rhododendron simsii]|uniref:Cupin type-1 domain-containing protein n=1 Tax=Rhododendron simsii TaxID=118357 RepID=A0A834GG31_RHOSS|nr:hypothetical protein RHSIM_Rhsim09G0137800 [Rhododendron simsii]
MASPSPLLTFTLYLVLCTTSSLAAGTSQDYQQEQPPQRRGSRRQGDCQIQNLNTLEPIRQMQHEAGVSEIWDQDDDQLQCAGVAASRHVIEPRGLLLPAFVNAPLLAYVLQGQGILGSSYPGCPETYQSFQQSQRGEGRQSQRDQHQKLVHFRRGDILAQPAGVAHWVYNDGGHQLVLVVIHDTNNHQNQVDQNLRIFPRRQPTRAAATTKKLQGTRTMVRQQHLPRLGSPDFGRGLRCRRGDIEEATEQRRPERVHRGVEKEFDVVRSPRYEEEEQERDYRRVNGLEETICTAKIKENIDDPERADIYTARAGRIRTLNSQNLPILRNLQLSAKRAVLYRVMVKLAGDEGLEWFSVQTNDLAKTSPLSGRTSVIRAIPVDVLANAYRISREEARRLKFNMDQEAAIHTQRRRPGEQRRAPANWAKNALLEVISKFE